MNKGSKSSERGRVYITDRENGKYWNGYLPGLDRWGFTWVERTIRNIREDEHVPEVRIGTVKIQGVELTVRDDGDGDWSVWD